MAGTSQGESTVEDQFMSYASKAQGTEATNSDMLQWMTDAGVFKGNATCTSKNFDQAFNDVRGKGKANITVKEVGALINRVSVQYIQDHAMTQKKALTTVRAMLAATKNTGDKAKSTKGTAASITDRLTDSSLYTGAHKGRFDSSGQGRGMAGRTDADDRDASGYVGNYKGAGSYGN